MGDTDPLEILRRHAETPRDPSSQYSEELLSELLGMFNSGLSESGSAPPPAVNIDLSNDDESPDRLTWPWLNLVSLAAATVLVLALGIAARGLLEDERIVTDDPVPTSTTEAPVVRESGVGSVPNFARIEKWSEFTDEVAPLAVQECASSFFFQKWLPRLVDSNSDDARTEGLGPVMRDARPSEQLAEMGLAYFGIRRLIQIEAGLAGLDEIDLALKQAAALQVDARAAIETGSLVDVTPFLNAAFKFSSFSSEQACPFGGAGVGVSPLAQALANFFSDEPNFGGFGYPAGIRCMTTAQLRSGLKDLAESSRELVAERVDLMWDLYESAWTDRDQDAGFASLKDRWGASFAADNTGEVAAELLSDLETYRAAGPDGAVCPLDSTYQPS